MKPKEVRIIAQSAMADFIDALMQQHQVMAPVRNAEGLCDFAWLEAPQQADLNCPVPRRPPKQAFLPRCETLFYYQRNHANETITAPPPPPPQLVLGLHPCDLQAIKVLDSVFSAKPFPDQPYLTRRAATTLIGRGSLNDDPLLFCRELGIDPMDNRDCDAFLTPLTDPKANKPGASRWALEIITAKASLLSSAYQKFPLASAEQLAALTTARQHSAARVVTPLDMAAIQGGLEQIFNSDFWDQIHEPCVACGACAFLCPTCHCFDIQEETHGLNGVRARVWDTCQFDQFTRHASGHNPRSSQRERIRQRIMHKFNYGVAKFKVPFCVGCGRCIAACPAHNDLRLILKKIYELTNR